MSFNGPCVKYPSDIIKEMLSISVYQTHMHHTIRQVPLLVVNISIKFADEYEEDAKEQDFVSWSNILYTRSSFIRNTASEETNIINLS